MKRFFKLLANLFLIYLILSFLIGLLKGVSDQEGDCTDDMSYQARGSRWHQRNWSFVDHSASFCGSYATSDGVGKHNADLRQNMNQRFRPDDYIWTQVYDLMTREGSAEVQFLSDSLISMAEHSGLDRLRLAELAVTFVQDIPYAYILPMSCEDYDVKGEPCQGNVPYGILSPYEFLHTELGDCDTRAVLLYILLRQMDFSPLMMISEKYAHAMVAINLPATGDYILYQNEKYYFWETTSKGWDLGMLPPNASNVDYWKIALAHEL